MTAIPVAVVVALVLTVVLLPPVSALARRLGAVATPRSDRWNGRPVPTLGGLAILGGVLLGCFLVPIALVDRLALIAGLFAMAMLGLADDLGFVSPGRRLLLEMATGAAFAAVASEPLALSLRVAAIAVAAACVPVAINATNLVDNADGLASVLSAVSGTTLAGIALAAGVATPGGGVAIVVAAASVGFLVVNRPPARVFMGDCGSLMLGFALAASSILIVRDAILAPGGAHVAVAIAIPLAWAFQTGDLLMVLVTRVRRKDPPLQGNVDHTSHRLMAAGLGPVALLFSLSLGAALVGAVAVAVAAWAGDFVLVTGLAIVAAGLVAAFEIAVAWRLPFRSPAAAEPAAAPKPAGPAEARPAATR